MKTRILILILLLGFSGHLLAQDFNHNPFKSIGKERQMLTLSDGKYDEMPNNDSIQHIGSVVINHWKRRIVSFGRLDSCQAVPAPDPTVISRFWSVDPLTKEYPELTPYQYASNTPVQAIDLDGLEAFYVHGTWSDPSTFSKVTKQTINTITQNTEGATFQWSGNNTDAARRTAAVSLAKHIIANRAANQSLTLVGHSHGGNVAIEAANILKGQGMSVDNLITFNTPVRDYQLNTQNSGVRHVQIYQSGDPVQANGGNDHNIPDGLSLMPTMFGIPFLKPSSFNGTLKGTGEVGSAGRTFQNAVNINESINLFSNHESHNKSDFWKSILNKAYNSKIKDINKPALHNPVDKTSTSQPKH